ncbi:MAG: 50S ribosomal protein L13 [Candidatus Diapherotrites archaeon]|nr:50S ribosomal protein L13 [Candidatus Diapherotrites archaeon]
MILVNAENIVLGRLASFAAKKALQGEQVVIVNSEKAIITGSREYALKRYKTKLDLQAKGNPRKSPKYSRMPDRMVRRAARGMLPWKNPRGKKAFKNITAFIGLPEKFAGKQFAEAGQARISGAKKTVRLEEICRLLGAKW